MIRLIAADMDGTLLNSQKQLSPELPDILRRLLHSGVRFAAASGRQYATLACHFGPLADQLYFISDNGSFIYEGARNIFTSAIEPARIAEAVRAVRQIRHALPVLCGGRSAYIDNQHPFFIENVQMYYNQVELVPDLLTAQIPDAICKIAVFDLENAETNSYPALKAFRDRFVVSLSGDRWVDLMNPGVNKGAAIRLLQDRYGIRPEESMAFGDYLNDCEMMQACAHSYAMENAHPKLKSLCRFTAKSNDEDGVVQVLKQVFSL